MKNENYDDNENSMTAEEFLDFMRKNRRTVPNEKRIANKDKFIWAVSELSETYEIDADLIEDDDGYTASLYMNYASYNGYIKKLLGLIFILSDDFSVFEAKDNRDSDLLMCFTYSLKPETVCIFYLRLLRCPISQSRVLHAFDNSSVSRSKSRYPLHSREAKRGQFLGCPRIAQYEMGC